MGTLRDFSGKCVEGVFETVPLLPLTTSVKDLYCSPKLLGLKSLKGFKHGISKEQGLQQGTGKVIRYRS